MGLDLDRIKAICFDIDGTMSDTDDRAVQRVVSILSPIQGLFPQMDISQIARRLVMSIETPGNWIYSLPDVLGIDDELAWIGEKLARLNNRPPDFLLIPGIERLLKDLTGRYPMAVVSARNKLGSEQFLNQFQLIPFFQQVITAQTCPRTKPYPDPLLYAASTFNVQPEELLMVGDTTVDIASARRAGAQSVGVLCGFGEEAELVRAGADLVLPNTSDLLHVLNSRLQVM